MFYFIKLPLATGATGDWRPTEGTVKCFCFDPLDLPTRTKLGLTVAWYHRKPGFGNRSYGELLPLGSLVSPHRGVLGPRQAGGALRARPGGCVVEDALLFHDVFAELRDAASALAAWAGGADSTK